MQTEVSIPIECSNPHCDEFPQSLVRAGLAVVMDNETGAVFCDANCHLEQFFGFRPAITMGEDLAQQRAAEWMARHR